ncbi:MAG: hypothetical protein FWD77_12235 [Betaproteobacteria bacterium]|nr:hypothetical protein [Betaproteobacteria bacterium]
MGIFLWILRLRFATRRMTGQGPHSVILREVAGRRMTVCDSASLRAG